MIPYISWWKRIIAWLIWRFEGYENTDDAFFYIIDHPNYTRVASLMRDYWYVRSSREQRDV